MQDLEKVLFTSDQIQARIDEIARQIDEHGEPGERLRVIHVGGAAMTLARYVAHTRPTSPQIVLEPDAELRRSRTESYLAFVRAAKPMAPANPVLAPGDKERKVRIERQAAGIPLDDETWSQIVAAARQHGLDAESY